MRIKNLFTTALAVLALNLVATAGDIYSIQPCDALGQPVSPAPADKYLKGGDTAYFMVRLAKRTSSSTALPFHRHYLGFGSEASDLVSKPPQIGIYVNGLFTTARYEFENYSTSKIFTDLIFSYTVKPGEFALPIRLADADRNVIDYDQTKSATAYSYYLNFRDASLGYSIWDFDDYNTDTETLTATAVFQYGTPSYPPGGDAPVIDYDLSKCNFQVKAIDFDANDPEGSSYWRTVHENSSALEGSVTARLVVEGIPTNSVRLYLWSADDTVFRLRNGVKMPIHVNGPDAPAEDRYVYTLDVVAGKGGEDNPYEFELWGVKKNSVTNLVLSAFTDYHYKTGYATPVRVKDYLTVPVKCSDPLPASVSIAPTLTKVKATSESYLYKVTELNVSFSEPFTEDVALSIEPSLTVAGGAVWSDYIRFSNKPEDDVTLQTGSFTNLIIKAGETKPQSISDGSQTIALADGKIYVYTLRGDRWSDGTTGKLQFKVTTKNAQALKPATEGGIDGWNANQSTLTVSAQAPVIESMFDGTDKATAIADSPRTLKIEVSDTWADTHCDPEQGEGYEIWVLKDADSTDPYVKVEGLFKPGKGGVLYLTNTTEVLPTVTYPGTKETFHSSVYIVAPISGEQSANHAFAMTVKTPDKIIVEYDKELEEGDESLLKVHLEDADGNKIKNTWGDLYVYIKGETAADTEAISAPKGKAVTGSAGISFAQYDYEPETFRVYLNDGDASKSGSTFYYKIVFLKTPTWSDDPNDVVSVYKNNTPLVFTTRNVAPKLMNVTLGLNDIQDGGVLKRKLPINIVQTFTLNVDEPGELDRTATDPQRPFQARWIFESDTTGQSGPIGYEEDGIVSGDPDEMKVQYNFPGAGVYTVTVELRDKDMKYWGNRNDETDTAEQRRNGNSKKFSFKVTVIDQPMISIGTQAPYSEYDSADFGGEGSIDIGLDVNECTFDLFVNVKIESNAATGTPADGVFALAESANVTKQPDGSYNVRFPRNSTNQTVSIQTLDGTKASAQNGWALTATMVEDNVHIVPNSGGKHPHEYYHEGEASPVKVNDEAPQLDPTTDVYPVPGTNAIPSSIGQADETITWSFSDVDPDFVRGMKVEIKGGGGWGPNTYYSYDEAMAAGAVGFRPTFTSSGKGQTVKLIITDPDGKATSVTWLYDVAASKSMKIAAHGPATGFGGSLGDRYASKAAGLGEGRVWAASKSEISVADWISVVNCGLEKTWMVYGYGYKVGEIDDGVNLKKYASRDTPINMRGANLGVGETAYTYRPRTDKNGNEVDSFLYTWLVLTIGEDATAGVTDAHLGSSTTLEKGEANDSGKLVTLPTEEDDEGGYATTLLEAVFAVEYLSSDNMGDINQDGIPDIYAKKFGFGVFDDSGKISGDDLAKLSGNNDDADYLPSTETSKYGALIPSLPTDWVTLGTPFKAMTEIRGYHEGLNNAPELAGVTGVKPDVIYEVDDGDGNMVYDETKCTISKTEYLAWCDYKAAHPGATFANWSPERPTDPTVADTDDDGFTDGYEYFFWYRAHVGFMDGTNHVYLTGRRYNPWDPRHPEIITSLEIETLMDPITGSGDAESAQTRDTDNDGLPDLLEFDLGTNPFDFDTDGDGLPDGYEILIDGGKSSYKPGTSVALDPLLYATDGSKCDADLNTDGDAKAELLLEDRYIVRYLGEDGVTTNYLGVLEEAKFEDRGDGTSNLVNEVSYEVWEYGNAGKLVLGKEHHANTTNIIVFGEAIKTNLVALHYHVYHIAGFDPRTAWSPTYQDYGVSYSSNTVANTTAYTVEDEYLLMTFFLRDGVLKMADVTPTLKEDWLTIWQKNTTNPFNPDGDADGAPDGWELYIMVGPKTLQTDKKKPNLTERIITDYYGPKGVYGPFVDFNTLVANELRQQDNDGLTEPEEFSGILSAKAYEDCSSISCIKPDWRNKTLPTDPWNDDTDGDGLKDGDEYTSKFLYDGNGVPGGGLNPNSWDTDSDGLPDPWELEFAGTFTTAAATSNTAASVTWNNNGMDGTVNDAMLDYDHDGLLNWQEYFAGTLRHFRYDDSVSQFGHQSFSVLDIPDESDAEAWGEFWYKTLVDDGSETADPAEMQPVTQFNPNLIGLYGQGTAFDGASTYFSYCTNAWDTAAYGKWYYFKDGIYHDLAKPPADKYWIPEKGAEGAKQYNRFTYRAAVFWGESSPYATSFTGGQVAPLKYISCDPRNPDTDEDGMDDYYELFHGLNPLLGESRVDGSIHPDTPRDVIFEAYENGDTLTRRWSPSAQNNWWLNNLDRHPFQPERIKPDSVSSSFDFACYPWLAGLAEADPDGDDIRNQKESILPNMQAAATYLHTDPTPLWMTDTSYDQSFPSRYYNLLPMTGSSAAYTFPSKTGTFTYTNGVTYSFADFPGFSWDKKKEELSFEFDNNRWEVDQYAFSFEENEGYDSDHDYLNDSRETEGRTKEASDPQQHDSPLRRQAMWFNGTDAFLETPVEEQEIQPYVKSYSEPRENFLYFTVEAWVKPDASTCDKQGKQIVVERSLYTGEAGPADTSYVRKNFMLGISNGRWYTGYHASGTSSECFEITDGPAATSTNWTHLAATYDGSNLVLYVNGIASVTKAVGREPEHGMRAASTTAIGGIDRNSYTWSPSVFLVGASARTFAAHYVDYYYRTGYNDNYLLPQLSDYQWFFKGYVDEVRVWDGARTKTAIQDDYEKRTRYTSALALENRQTVYTQWKQGARRTPTSALTLPAQLIHHWTFDHLPGAIKLEDVEPVPAGFSASAEVTDAKALWVRPECWSNAWWQSFMLRSTVYSPQGDWVPWINDTVAHLPRLDKTTVDSVYWSADYAGATSAASESLGSFAFPRSAEVFSKWVQVYYSSNGGVKGEPYTQPTRWDMIEEEDDADELISAYHFTIRNRNRTGDDLLPMGGAFPRRISASEGGLWDKQGAADAWAETGIDSNNDGLPDWWTQYALENYKLSEDPSATITWDTSVNYHGVIMPAWQAYKRDLAKGMFPDGTILGDEYADKRDADADGLPDWWEEMYRVQGNSSADADADPDKDGLSNYAEYLLSEVYPKKYKLYEDHGVANKMLNPTLAHSYTNQVVTDYFLRYSADDATEITNAAGKGVFFLNEYFGEITSDHDFMEDWWEQQYNVKYVSSKKYDPLEDADEDGWSNWAECRAALWGGAFNASLIDSWCDDSLRVFDHPEPIIGVRVAYRGTRDVSGRQLVIRTTTGQSPRVDATFVIPNTYQAYPQEHFQRGRYGQTRIIGTFSGDSLLRGHMSPGQLLTESIIFERAKNDLEKTFTWSWAWYDENEIDHPRVEYGKFETYLYYQRNWPMIKLTGSQLSWEAFAVSAGYGDGTTVDIILNNSQKLGTVNVLTGEYELNMDNIDKPVDGYIYRVSYETKAGHEWPQTFYVSDTLEYAVYGKNLELLSSKQVVGSGRLKEGRNLIEVFMDMDGDGVWDQGEPFGSVRNVLVGWHKVPVVTVELKDESSIMPAVAVSGSTDKTTVSELTKTVRVTRRLINGLNVNEGKRLTARSLVTKEIVLDDHAYVSEADVVYTAKPDLDWSWLVRDAKKFGIENIETVTYSVDEVQTLLDGSTTNITLSTFVKTFSSARTTPTAVSPLNKAPVYSASPALRFSASDDKATGYRLQIKDAVSSTLVYDSGIRILPGRVGGKVGQPLYEVTPPVFADMTVYAGETTNRFVFADGSNYQWRVALVNAKFNTVDDADYCAWAEFQMDVGNVNRYPDQPTGYGNVEVAVRYFGPTNLAPEQVIVEAFENADFSGQPMAQVRLGKTAELLRSPSDVTTWNAFLFGLTPGKVYFRAYFDQNDNGIRDRWETWGYANHVGKSLKAMYNPLDYTVMSTAANWAERPEADIVIYMEDCDLNQNEYPDCIDAEGDWLSAVNADTPYWIEPENTSSVVTDPMTDTDGDGMPDLWENWNDGITDPFVADGDTLPENDVDVMAYLTYTGKMVTIQDGSEGGLRLLLADGQNYRSQDGKKANAYTYTTWYLYGPAGENGQVYGVGTNVTVSASYEIESVADVTVALVHAQVYAKKGYSTLTANPVAFATGKAVDTKAFTALDRYLVMRYFDAIGATPSYPSKYKSFEEYAMNAGEEVWKKWTLMPGTVDANHDFVADGWQLYVMYGTSLNLGASAGVGNRGKTSPWGSIGATASGTPDNGGLSWRQEYDAGHYPTDPWNKSTENIRYTIDGVKYVISDKDAYAYRLKGDDRYLDSDNDGLVNYDEYVIMKNSDRTLSVDKMCSYFGSLSEPSLTGQCVPDYFLKSTKTPKYYLGFKYTSHDFIESWWKDQYDPERRQYDPSGDDDGDGWSNWSEARAGTNPGKVAQSAIEGYSTVEYPVPVVKLTLTDENGAGVSNAAVIVEARRASAAGVTSEARWAVGDASAGTGEKFVGFNPGVRRSYNVGGSIVPGSFSIVFKDLTGNVETYMINSNTMQKVKIQTLKVSRDEALWADAVIDTKIDNASSKGYLVDRQNGDTIYGTVNYDTGDVVIYFDVIDADQGEDGAWRTWTSDTECYVTYYWKSYVKCTWETMASDKADTSVRNIVLSDATEGHLREGLNTFVAFADENGNGAYDPGEPFGMAQGVDVGWDKVVDLRIDLTKTSPVLPRFDIADFGTSTNAVDGTNQTIISGAPVITDVAADARVRIVRWAINGEECFHRIVFAKTADTIGVITEADVLSKLRYDLDWGFLGTDAAKLDFDLADVTAVTYAVFVGDEAIAEENVNGWIVKRFAANRAKASPVSPSQTKDAKVTATRPTFAFTVPDGYPAYVFELSDADGNVVCCSTNLVGRKDAQGNETYRPPVYFGWDAADLKNSLLPNGDYSWRVSMLNAKFCTAGDWSEPAAFTVELAKGKVHDSDKGILDVIVRYYGEATVDAAHPIVVQAFKSADFTGVPEGQAVITSTDLLASYDNTNAVNAKIFGLDAGEYYVRAFVDTTNDTVRSTWESWGYLNNVTTDKAALYTPVSVTVARNDTSSALVFIEDTDKGNDGIPDCLQDYPADDPSEGPNAGIDSDGDGLTDAEEDVYGTDKLSADSDEDGMPDGWEIWAETDPLTPDADTVSAGDVMAYKEVDMWLVTLTDGTHVLLKDGETLPKPGDDIGGRTNAFYAAYAYGDVYGRGLLLESVSGVVKGDLDKVAVALVHDQVYEAEGFCKDTAVPNGTVNTKSFDAIDKYLLWHYLYAMGEADSLDENAANWAKYTLKPGNPDCDNDGIGDGWELYVGANPWNAADRTSDTDNDGATLLQEYDFDRTTGVAHTTDPNSVVTGNDGIKDNFYHEYLLWDSAGDFDGDGLSNYAEYLISEVFQYAKLDPRDPKTDGSCIDYFRKMGELYFGEIFTDHDQVDDLWEESFADSANDGKAFANRYVYDPSRDADGDGWSNYAEAKAGTNPGLIESVGIDGYTYAEHPVPMIEAHVTYNGRLNAIVAPVVFKAWNESEDADMVKAPDAIWTVSASTTSEDSKTTSTKNREKYLGKNPRVTRTFTLGPGVVSPGTVRVYFRDQAWQRATVYNGVELNCYTADASTAKWHALVQDLDGVLYTSVTNETSSTAVGTVDYTTGRITLFLDSPALTRSVYATMSNASQSKTSGSDTTTALARYYNCEKLNLAESYVKVGWTSTVIGTSVGGTYYLGDADKPGSTAATLTRGYVREGKTKFVVFADTINVNGKYDAGEPFGFVSGVDVGWQGASFSVDLTDTHPVFARISLKDGSNDRAYWSSMASTIKTNSNDKALTSAPSGNVRVRVVRTAVNGMLMTDMKNPADEYEHAPQTVVMDKTFNTDVRAYLHEGDFIDATNYDIDWKTLASDAAKYQPVEGDNKWKWPVNMTNVTYRIVFGDGEIGEMSKETSTFLYLVDRCFDKDKNGVMTVIEPYASVVTYNTRPVFKWAVTSGGVNYNSYTTFKIEVLKSDGITVLYDSGLQTMPEYKIVDGLNYYAWTAPSIVDNLQNENGQIARNGTYAWRVSVYNAKFRTGKASDLGTLTTAVNVTHGVNDTGYSTTPVCVKYTGPVKVLEKMQNLGDLQGKVRVQAFTTADFSGQPISETIVTNDLADTSKTVANGKLYGLPVNGSYYLRAYIDSNGNLKKDEWESWGAAMTIVASGEKTPAGIWIEDADTDDDWLPDAWEFAKAGWDEGIEWLNKESDRKKSGEFNVTKKLKDAVNNTTLTAGVSSGMSGASLTVFTYDTVAKLVCGSTDYSFSSVDEIRKAVEKKIKADTVKITSITLDPNGKKVVLGVGAETAQTIAGRTISKIYDFGTSVTVTVKVYKKNSLVENWSDTPVCTKEVRIIENLDTLVDVNLDPALDLSSGYFKVDVVQ